MSELLSLKEALDRAFRTTELVDDDIKVVGELFEYFKFANYEEMLELGDMGNELVEILDLISEDLKQRLEKESEQSEGINRCLKQIRAIKSYLPNTEEYRNRLAKESKDMEREYKRLEETKINFIKLLMLLKVVSLKNPPYVHRPSDYINNLPSEINLSTLKFNITQIQEMISESLTSRDFEEMVEKVTPILKIIEDYDLNPEIKLGFNRMHIFSRHVGEENAKRIMQEERLKTYSFFVDETDFVRFFLSHLKLILKEVSDILDRTPSSLLEQGYGLPYSADYNKAGYKFEYENTNEKFLCNRVTVVIMIKIISSQLYVDIQTAYPT